MQLSLPFLDIIIFAIIANIIISINGKERFIVITFDNFKLIIDIYQFIYVYSNNVQSFLQNK